MRNRGQGAFEYLLLLGGTVLVATVVVVMAQTSVYGANNSFDNSTNDFGTYVTGGVKDLLANGSLVHESPSGCSYNNPPCDAGYYCSNQNVCVPISSVLLSGYAFDPSGNALSGVTVNVSGGNGSVATTNAAGRYDLVMNVSIPSALYSVIASRAPTNAPAGATVNLTAGFATFQNFTLGYNNATLSGYVRDASSAGVNGAAVSCGSYSTTTGSNGAYTLVVPMSSASSACTRSVSKAPTFVSSSASVTLNAGTVTSQNLVLAYSPASLSGFIRNSSGAGINGAAVSCAGKTATTSSAGAYSISGIAMTSASTTCTLAASKPPAFVSGSASVALAAGTAVPGQNLQLAYANALVCGKVNDSAGVSLSGVNVTCGTAFALSNATGHYNLSVPMPNASSVCTLGASKLPANPLASASVGLNAGLTSSRNFTLNYSNAMLLVRLLDVLGNPIANTNVRAAWYGTVNAMPTNATGQYLFSAIAMNTSSLNVSLRPLSALSAPQCPSLTGISDYVNVSPGAITYRTIQATGYCNALLTGYVRDSSSNALNGAVVACGSASATSSSSGSYAFEVPMAAAASTCSVSASKAAYSTGTQSVSLAQNAKASQNFSLSLADATVVRTISVGDRPYGIAVTPNGAYAYVANYGPNTVSVINTATNAVVATITGLNSPYDVAITPNGAYAYVTNNQGRSLSVISTATNSVVGTIPFSTGYPGLFPYGLAITPNGAYVYVASLQEGSDVGRVHVISTSSNSIVGTISVGNSAQFVAVHPNGAYAYAVSNPSSNNGYVSVINTASNSVVGTVSIGTPVGMVAASPNGAYVYTTTGWAGTVPVISTASNSVVSTIRVGGYYYSDGSSTTRAPGPWGVSFAPSGNYAYVTNRTAGTVLIVNTASNAIVKTLSVGGSPWYVAFAPGGAYAYVAKSGSSAVAVISTGIYK